MDLTPHLVSFLFFAIPGLIVLWFMISTVTALREGNELLKELIKKLEKKSVE
ncbi:hypothetical protein [Ureibacillus manganicus]|uniref:hypothetical protein n=1 Tax=Ureibacillus manganicus TaxID=1266064 RepID=UPI000A7ED729|nr:hypothetical protein [Ureibacillus manganicus]